MLRLFFIPIILRAQVLHPNSSFSYLVGDSITVAWNESSLPYGAITVKLEMEGCPTRNKTTCRPITLGHENTNTGFFLFSPTKKEHYWLHDATMLPPGQYKILVEENVPASSKRGQIYSEAFNLSHAYYIPTHGGFWEKNATLDVNVSRAGLNQSKAVLRLVCQESGSKLGNPIFLKQIDVSANETFRINFPANVSTGSYYLEVAAAKELDKYFSISAMDRPFGILSPGNKTPSFRLNSVNWTMTDNSSFLIDSGGLTRVGGRPKYFMAYARAVGSDLDIPLFCGRQLLVPQAVFGWALSKNLAWGVYYKISLYWIPDGPDGDELRPYPEYRFAVNGGNQILVKPGRAVEFLIVKDVYTVGHGINNELTFKTGWSGPFLNAKLIVPRGSSEPNGSLFQIPNRRYPANSTFQIPNSAMMTWKSTTKYRLMLWWNSCDNQTNFSAVSTKTFLLKEENMVTVSLIYKVLAIVGALLLLVVLGVRASKFCSNGKPKLEKGKSAMTCDSDYNRMIH